MAIVAAIAVSVVVILSLSFSPLRTPGPRILANTSPSFGSLGDFWNGNAYFERQTYVTPYEADTCPVYCYPVHEVAPVQKDSNTIYMYYRDYKNAPDKTKPSNGEIGLATSADGGASYGLYNSGIPVLNHGSGCDWDAVEVIAPSVVIVNGIYYMVYEGRNSVTCGFSYDAGDVGLATSSDGQTWQKKGVIINHGSGFEVGNIGTPSIAYFNGKFYVFFHGFDTVRSHIGMASGQCNVNGCTLQQYTDANGNPIPIMDIGKGPLSWDSYVNSRASVIWDSASGNYYMTFEASQSVGAVCSSAGIPVGNWGWGIARSASLDNPSWEKYLYNPIRQTYQSGCGNDLPYIFVSGGSVRVYQREQGHVNVLLTGSDPYLRVYMSTSQCQTYHQVGQLESDGWSATTGFFQPSTYMCYGPYEGGLPTGKFTVNFRDMIDTTSGSNNEIIQTNINDFTANSVQRSLDIYRSQFVDSMKYQMFNLQFSATSGHSYEWRTFWYNNAYDKQNLVMVRQIDGFALGLLPTSQVIPVGSEQQTVLTVTSVNGWSGTVNLVATPSSSAVVCWFTTHTNTASVSVPAGGSSTEYPTCTGGPAGQYSVSIAGTAGTLSNSIALPVNVADFSMSAPSTVSFLTGSPSSATISVASLFGFSGTVGLSTSAPSGLSVSCPSSVNVNSGGTAAATCSLSSSSPGTYSVTATGSFVCTTCYYGAQITHSVTFSVSVGDFSISLSPTFQPIPVGSEQQTQLTINSLSGFTGTVNLLATPSSTTVACWFTGTLTNTASVYVPPGGTGSQAPTCTGSQPGQYTVLFTGTFGSGTRSAVLNVNVTDFTVSASAVSFPSGSSSPGSINFSSLYGFSGTVTLSVSAPSGVTVSSCPSSVSLTSGRTATASCSFSSTTPGTYSVSATGSFRCTTCYYGAQITHSATVTVNVGDFSISLNPSSASISKGSSTTTTITLTSLYSFSGQVSLTTQLSPTVKSPPVVSLSASTITLASNGSGTATMNVSSSGSTAKGTYSVTVTAKSGSIVHTATFTVTIT